MRRTIGFNTQYQTSDVAENLGKYASFTERTCHGKDFELILTVKMETRHPVESQFGSEFFRRSVIIEELWRPKVARPGNFLSNFCVFFWINDPVR